jgi:tetratricopeptide (TPR) repeat protein
MTVPRVRRSNSSPERLVGVAACMSKHAGGWAAGGSGSLAQSLAAARHQAQEAAQAEDRLRLVNARDDVRRARRNANAAARSDRWSDCEAELTAMIENADIDLNDPSVYTYRSRALLKQQKIPQALADADRAVALAPMSARGHHARARALWHAGNHSSAGKKLCETLDLSPRYSVGAGERFEDLLHGVRRSRIFWPGAARRERTRMLASTPPPKHTVPGQCREVATHDVTYHSLRLTWKVPSDDGGDEICRYEVEVAALDPLLADAPLDFQLAFAGLPRELNVSVSDLTADTDLVVRIAAINECGRGKWSPELKVTTLICPPGSRELDRRIPQSWLDLRANMSDLLSSARKSSGIDEQELWDDLVEAWRAHLGSIKLAYRLYVLLESTAMEPKDITLTQFRGFVSDCQIVEATKTNVDLIFTRVNRVAAVGSNQAAVRDSRMGRDEFVHGILRLGLLRESKNRGGAGASLAKSFSAIMEDCVTPHAVLDLKDEMSEVLQSRGVRAVLAKHQPALQEQYELWAQLERGVGESSSSDMSLNELLLALKEAKVLDEACTAREVTSFFVRVNADDEIYLGGKADGASTLDFGEFCEIIARICDEKMPRATANTPFETTLDTWLGLFLLPALRNAGRARLAPAANARSNKNVRASKGISAQSSSQANSRRPSKA